VGWRGRRKQLWPLGCPHDTSHAANFPTPTEIKEDVAEECGKFGKVVTLKIPRPVEGKEVEGVGKVSGRGWGEGGGRSGLQTK
jgi:hypothetical protein